MNNTAIDKNTLRITLKAAIAAFGVYFCMYAFRKPFTVASFSNLEYFGFNYKILIVIAQAVGYFFSKFIGIKLISELATEKRIIFLLSFIAVAELSLLAFATISPPYNIIFMFINGLPLGMIWGIVFSYIEGRKTTEIIGLFLCSSFIVSSGVVKSVGKLLMDHFEISEFWMPFATGLLFIIPLVVFAIILNQLPEPTAEDKALKKERKTLKKEERKSLVKRFFLPLMSITVLYVTLTILRDFRDNFSREIWDEINGVTTNSAVFTLTEIPVFVMVLLILGLATRIKNNQKAFIYYHYILFVGISFVGLSTFLFQKGFVTSFLWMILSGFGMYLCYIPFNGNYFDRMIAAFKIKGNVGFFIYFVDTFGYLGSIFILLLKNLGSPNQSWLEFYIYLIYAIVAVFLLFVIIAFLAFEKKSKSEDASSLINLDTFKS